MLDPTAPYTYGVAVQPTRKTMYQLVFEGDASHAAATSPTVTVTPEVKLGKPHAPSSVKKGKQFTAYGDLTPKADSREPHGQDQVLPEEVRRLEAQEDREDHEQELPVRLALLGQVLADGHGQLEAGGLRGGDVQVRRDDVFGRST